VATQTPRAKQVVIQYIVLPMRWQRTLTLNLQSRCQCRDLTQSGGLNFTVTEFPTTGSGRHRRLTFDSTANTTAQSDEITNPLKCRGGSMLEVVLVPEDRGQSSRFLATAWLRHGFLARAV
jgi:hypothetical protein